MRASFRFYITSILFLCMLSSCKDNAKQQNPEGFSPNRPIHAYKKKKGPKAFDDPDEYSKYFDNIRTKEGESRPAYGYNYKLKALEKARRNGPRLSSRATTFTERGPSNVPGRTRSILPDPNDPSNTWIAASVSGGIWRTTNGGQNWVHLTPDLPNLMFTTLAQSPTNPNIIYAGTGERALGGALGDGDGMFKSIDRGNTWTQLSVGVEDPFFQNVSRIIVSPTDPNLVLACGGTEDRDNTPVDLRSGVFRSTDGGQSWARTFSDSYSISQIIAAPTDFNQIYVSVVGRGIFKSEDAGLNWTRTEIGLPEKLNRLELAIGKNPDWVFISLEREIAPRRYTGEVYYSLNGGVDWQRMVSVPGGIDRDLLGGQGSYDNTIMVHPYTDSILYIGGVDLWEIQLLPDGNGAFFKDVIVLVDSYSRAVGADKGRNSWFEGGVHPDQHFLGALPGDSPDEFKILVGNDGGIYLSDSDRHPGFTKGSWNMLGNTYNTTQFYGADKRPDKQQYVGGSQDNGTWIFSGQLQGQDDATASASSPYSFIIGGDGFEVVWNKADPDIVLGGAQFNNFSRVNVKMGTSEPATKGLYDVGGGKAPFVSRIANVATDPDLVYTGGRSGLWRSDDFGKNWSLTPITTNWFYTNSSPDIAVSPKNPQIVWAANGMSTTRTTYVSIDGGYTLNPIPEAENIGVITGVYTHPLDEETAYLLFSQKGVPKILRTTDLGQTWEDLSGFKEGIDRGFPDVAVFALQVMPHDPDILWAGTEIGIIESRNGGDTWQLLDDFPNVMVWDLKWVDNEIVISTYGRGIWTATIPELGDVPLPSPILGPRILCLTSDINTRNGVVLETELRGLYDSTHIILNGSILEKLGSNGDPETIRRTYVQETTDELEVLIRSFKDGESYYSGKQVLRSSDKIDFIFPVGAYSSDFDTSEYFVLSEFFEIGTLEGFTGKVLHTDHPYKSGQDLTGGTADYTAALRFPIVVSNTDPMLRYRDVAIVELGEPGATFGGNSFYDYVIVEGSKNLKDWKALSSGYDARLSTTWEAAYRDNLPGDSSMFVDHEIDLSQQFAPGDTIAIRFRLFTDPLATGWGWAIDKLEIQTNQNAPDPENLSDAIYVYPNPFDEFIIALLDREMPDNWGYKILDARGSQVRMGQFPVNQLTALRLDVSDLPSGLYFLQLIERGEVLETRKLVKR